MDKKAKRRGYFLELTDEEKANIDRASGIPSGKKGAFIGGIRNMIACWKRHEELSAVTEEARADAE